MRGKKVATLAGIFPKKSEGKEARRGGAEGGERGSPSAHFSRPTDEQR